MTWTFDCLTGISSLTMSMVSTQGPSVRRPVSAEPGVKFPGLNLTLVSISCVQKHFLGLFSLLFLELPIINFFNSNLALTLGYLNPALNNSAQFLTFTPLNPSIVIVQGYRLYLCGNGIRNCSVSWNERFCWSTQQDMAGRSYFSNHGYTRHGGLCRMSPCKSVIRSTFIIT